MMKTTDKICWGDVEPLGFRCSEMFVPSAKRHTGYFWKRRNNLVFFTTFDGQGGKFRLSPEDTRSFAANKLHLVPPGCCNASGGATREFSPGRDSFPIPKDEFLKEAAQGV